MIYRSLKDLKELTGNPRTIKTKDFKILCDSIRNNSDYFEARPLILSDRTGELIIIAGNQRYKAAKEIGLKEVPTYLIENLTEEKEREIIIRDNISNGEWEIETLANEWDIDQLKEWGLNLSSFNTPKDISAKIISKLLIEIEVTSEREQEQLYNQLTKDGYQCRILNL